MANDGGQNKVKINILGNVFTLRGGESTDHLMRVAALVDDVMKQIAKTNPNLDTKKVAVLAALNLADSLEKLKAEYADLLTLLDEQT